jgi:hypothetical protein
MSFNLTPEQLAQLYAQFQAGNYNLNEGGFAPTAVVHSGEDAGNPSQLLGYTGNFSDPTRFTPGSTYDMYGTNGGYAGQQKVQDGGSVSDMIKGTIGDNAQGLALFASLYGLGSLVNGGFLGFGGAGAPVDPSLAVQGNSINALDAGSAGMAANGGVAVPYGSEAAAGGGSLLGGGAANAGGVIGPAASNTAFEKALEEGASSVPSWLKYAAPILGAVAGSQGTQNSSTQHQEMTPELKPYIFGGGSNPGLVGYTQQTLDKMMAPGFLAGYDQMRGVGQHLMATPQAGNLYDKFFGANAQPIRYQPSGPARPISAFGGL